MLENKSFNLKLIYKVKINNWKYQLIKSIDSFCSWYIQKSW